MPFQTQRYPYKQAESDGDHTKPVHAEELVSDRRAQNIAQPDAEIEICHELKEYQWPSKLKGIVVPVWFYHLHFKDKGSHP